MATQKRGNTITATTLQDDGMPTTARAFQPAPDARIGGVAPAIAVSADQAPHLCYVALLVPRAAFFMPR